MKFLYCPFILYFYLFLVSFSHEEIINNPILTEKNLNIIDYKIIFHTENIKSQTESNSINVKLAPDFKKFIHGSYVISQPLVNGIDEDNINYLFLEDKCYFIQFITQNQQLEINSLRNKVTLESIINYTDYMISFRYTGVVRKNCMSSVKASEIILYGKSGEYVYFYYKIEGISFHLYFGDIDEIISCKLVSAAIYFCAYSQENKVKIKIFQNIYTEDSVTESRELKLLDDQEVVDFTNHDSVVLYNTTNDKYRILCAREKTTNRIECLIVEISTEYKVSNGFIPSTTWEINFHQITSDYETSFSFNENGCNFTKYGNEYLICCGIEDGIICDKRDIDFKYINSFSINSPGKIRNLTFEIDEDNIRLIYSNQTDSENIVYEYYIYYPDCTDFNVSMNSWETVKILLNDFYKRKTNTKFYIKLTNFQASYYSLTVNKEDLENDVPKLLKDGNNIMYFTSRNRPSTKIFNYTISIEEVFSKTCKIFLEIKKCYSSCRNCTKSIDNSNEENHNCMFCSDNFYHFQNETNCYSLSDVEVIHPDWYLDEEKIFLIYVIQLVKHVLALLMQIAQVVL